LRFQVEWRSRRGVVHGAAQACRDLPLQAPEPSALRFIDEYHYRAESQSLIAERLAEQIA
jgi:hypothetical protein